MDEIKQKENETRQNYLLRVVYVTLKDNAGYMDSMIYDNNMRDASHLAEDLKTEFNIKD